MLLAILPSSIIVVTIWPLLLTLAVLLVIQVLAFIGFAIRPRVEPMAMHLVFLPLALVYSTVRPKVVTYPVHLIFGPHTSIYAFITPCVSTVAVFEACFIFSFKAGSIWPCFLALSLLQVFNPFANVLARFQMVIGPPSVSHIILPFAIVEFTVTVQKLSLSICLSVGPCTNVFSAIRPYLSSLAISLAIHPLACVYSSTV